MLSEDEVREYGKHLCREHFRLKYHWDLARPIQTKIDVVQKILNDPLVECSQCKGKGSNIFNEEIYRCPVCDGTGEITTLHAYECELRKEEELRKVIEEWGIH